MERHLPHCFLSDVEWEGKFDHILVQTVVVRGCELTSVRHAFDAVQAKPRDGVELANDAGVLPID